MKGNHGRLYLPINDIYLVSTQNNGNALTHANNVSVPRLDVIVGASIGHIKHDNGTLAFDVVPIAEPTEPLLPRGVPHIEDDGAVVGEELERVYSNPYCRIVLLLKLASTMSADERCFSRCTISNEE